MQSKSITTMFIFSAVALLISILSFSQNGAEQPPSVDTLSKIIKSKEMVACYAVFPPAVIKDAKTGEVSGHDVDALRLIAKEIGAELRLEETTFGNMATAIQSGQCDIGTSLFVKIPRASVVAFSNPLFFAGNSGLVRKGDTRFKTIDDVNQPGIKVVVATGESGDIYATSHLTNASITRIDVASSDLSRFLLEVTSGRADIGIADANTISIFAKNHPESEDVFANNTFDLNPDAFPLPLGDIKFLNFINNSLGYLESSGTWMQLEKKYDAHWLHEVKQYKVQ